MNPAKQKSGRSTREYNLWQSICQRCTNPNNPLYPKYGALGVSVDPKWRESFDTFFADVGEAPSSQHKLELLREKDGYRRGNCEWRQRRHGYFGTKVYRAWASMLARCYNQNNSAYRYYGALGVKVCSRWRDFNNFLEDMGEPPSVEHSLDKKRKLYSKKTCRWATPYEQANNLSTNRWITYRGVTRTIAQWARVKNLNYDVLYRRLTVGWDLARALETPCVSRVDNIARTSIYKAWDGMMGRCYRPKMVGYERYGGRGIQVVTRWHTFRNFIEAMHPKPPGYCLDRLRTKENYSKRNCRWAPKGAGRMSHERLVTYRG